MLDPPSCLDVCALYGRSNPALVARLLGSLGELDGGAAGVRLAAGLEESGLAAARALAEVHAKVKPGTSLCSPGWGVGWWSVGFVSRCVRLPVRCSDGRSCTLILWLFNAGTIVLLLRGNDCICVLFAQLLVFASFFLWYIIQWRTQGSGWCLVLHMDSDNNIILMDSSYQYIINSNITNSINNFSITVSITRCDGFRFTLLHTRTRWPARKTAWV